MPDDKYAILLLAHELNDVIFERFDAIHLLPGYSKFLLVDCTMTSVPAIESLQPFTFETIKNIGYAPIRDAIVPGSNHFPSIEFIVNHNYAYVWTIEFDVLFTGDWRTFFLAQDSPADLLTAGICHRSVKPRWYWWRSLMGPHPIDPKFHLLSFNPIYRLSRRAAVYLKRQYLEGWIGHHEVSMPTLLASGGYIVEDFGGDGSFVKPENRNQWYTHQTHRCKLPGDLSSLKASVNMILHPVKSRL